jgi:hypothetical protein
MTSLQPDLAIIGIKVRDHAKKETLAGSRRPGDRGTVADTESEFEWAREFAAQLSYNERR